MTPKRTVEETDVLATATLSSIKTGKMFFLVLKCLPALPSGHIFEWFEETTNRPCFVKSPRYLQAMVQARLAWPNSHWNLNIDYESYKENFFRARQSVK